MNKRIAVLGTLLAVVMVVFAAFSPAPVRAEEPTIADIVVQNEGFSTLLAALQAAGLTDVFASPGSYTVFAPTNEAFQRAFDALGITAADLLADTDTLTSILLYHVTAGEVFAADVLKMDSIAMLDGNLAEFSVKGGVPYINNAPITNVDIYTSNGVIHVIDEVILPPAPAPRPFQFEDATIADIVVQNEGFSTLLAALQAAGLTDVFASPGSYTVFAPTNEAFQRAFDALGITAADLLADTDTLTSILLYHVTAGEVFAADVLSTKSIVMLDGNIARFFVIDGVAYINNAPITNVDIYTSNGVIHVIDEVILPPTFAAIAAGAE